MEITLNKYVYISVNVSTVLSLFICSSSASLNTCIEDDVNKICNGSSLPILSKTRKIESLLFVIRR